MALALSLLRELPLERYITHEFSPEKAPDAYAMLDGTAESMLQCVFKFDETA
jgi:hypothetical protein